MPVPPLSEAAQPPLLFRQEAVDAQRAHFLGDIRIAQNPSFVLVTGIALVLGAALIAFALFGQATRKTTVSGLLLPSGGLLHLSSQQPGTVTTLNVHEGDEVLGGQLLAVLRIGGASTRGDTSKLIAHSITERRLALETERRNAQAQTKQREAALSDKLRSLQRDITQAEGELDATQQRAKLQQSSLDRDKALAIQGFVSEAQVQARQEERLDLQVRLRNVQRNLESLKRDAQSLQADIEASSLQGQTTLSQIDRALASIAQEETENSARAEWTIRSPQPGTVSAINTYEGQMMQAGQTLLSLIPQKAKSGTNATHPPDLVVQLFAPSRGIGFVQPGQVVWIRLQAFPYQKFGMVQATVQQVSRTPVNPRDLPAGFVQNSLISAGANEPLYSITAQINPNQKMHAYGETLVLKAGMALDADVVQDRRAIWEWVLEPIFAMQKKSHLSS